MFTRMLVFAVLTFTLSGADVFAQAKKPDSSSGAKVVQKKTMGSSTTNKKNSGTASGAAIPAPAPKDAAAEAIKLEAAALSEEAKAQAAKNAELRALYQKLMAEEEASLAKSEGAGGIEGHAFWGDFEGCMLANCGGDTWLVPCFEAERRKRALDACAPMIFEGDEAAMAEAVEYFNTEFLVSRQKKLCNMRHGVWENKTGRCAITVVFKRHAERVGSKFGVDVPDNGCNDNKPRTFYLGSGEKATCLATQFGAAQDCWQVDRDAVKDGGGMAKAGLILGGITTAGSIAMGIYDGSAGKAIIGGVGGAATAVATPMLLETKVSRYPVYGQCFMPNGLPIGEGAQSMISFDWIEVF